MATSSGSADNGGVPSHDDVEDSHEAHARVLVLLVLASLVGVLGVASTATAVPSGAATAPSGPPTAERPVDPIAHDPTMVREKGWYYVAITGDAGVATPTCR